MFSALLLLLSAGSCVSSLDLIQPYSLVLRSGQPLSISCQVSGYSLTDNSYGTGWVRHTEGNPLEWIFHQWGGGTLRQNNNLKNKFSYSRNTDTGEVTIKGPNPLPEDDGVYYCVRYRGVDYYFDYWGKGTVVTVSDSAVRAPTVFPLVQCGSGTGDVALGCMATGFTPASLTFKWELEGNVLTDAVQYPTSKKNDQYTGVSQIRVRRQDWDARKLFTCTALHAGGNVKAEIEKEVVVHKLPALSILVSETKGSEMVSLGCFAAEFSPKDYTITWLRNGEKIDPLQISTSSKNGTFYNAASYIQVGENRWKDAGTNITCMFTNGKEHVEEHLSYNSENCENEDSEQNLVIDILPISLEKMYLEQNAELVCKVESSEPVEVQWFNESGVPVVVMQKSEQIPKIPPNTYIATAKINYDEWSKGMNWYCKASIKDSITSTKKYFQKNNGPDRSPPSVYLLPPVDDLSCKNMTLTCFVKDFYPMDVLVHWLVDDSSIDGNALYSHKTTNVIENNGKFSTYGQLTFSSDSWKDGRVFGCEVYHVSMDSKSKPIVRLITEKTSGNVNIVNMNLSPSTCLLQ